MHEASIAYSLINMLVDIVKRENARFCVRAKIKVGALSGVVVDSLAFAFEALKVEFDETKTTELIIEEVPLTYMCRKCKRNFSKDDFFFPECPFCGNGDVEMIGGEELDLEDVELEI